MTHKIAIITSRDRVTGDYDEYHSKIIESITDWEEVTDEEFMSLQSSSYRMGFTVLEQPTEIRKFIAKTVADYKKLVKEENAQREKDRLEREAAALKRKIKKELKDKVSKEKMLEKLSEELGVEIVKKI